MAKITLPIQAGWYGAPTTAKNSQSVIYQAPDGPLSIEVTVQKHMKSGIHCKTVLRGAFLCPTKESN
ncbi:MAG: hypothetical protein K2O66_04575 [Bacteroidales bacterium]|nr:hypothetical protein [Bacteroidales bacterium]MDE7072618.1 hypothetical protein [Bacteroidales bacterium]